LAQNYCSLDDVRRAAAISEALSTEQTNSLNAWMPRAWDMIDNATGTWFDSRHLEIRTRPAQKFYQQSLFLPAPSIQLDSITVDGEALDPAKDVVEVEGALEMADESYWSCSGRLGIIITGTFGLAAVPGPITELAAQLTAIMAGLKTRAALDAQGTFEAIRINKLPDWAMEILETYRRQTFCQQPFVIKAVV
jgi:hypothetical protein